MDQRTRDDDAATRTIRTVDRLDGYVERAAIPHVLISERRQPKLFKSIIGVRNELPQKDLSGCQVKKYPRSLDE